MFLDTNIWQRRFDRIMKAAVWLALLKGSYETFAVTALDAKIDPGSFTALAASVTYAVILTFIPRGFMLQPRRIVVESVALVGSALTMAAVSLTGGIASPYLLLSLTPIIFGSFFGAFRIGLATAGFASILLVVQTIPFEDGTVPITEAILLYFLVAMTFAQAQRLLVAEVLRASASAQAFEEAQMRLSRLEHANDLLTRLATLTDSRELNPIEVGEAALDGLTRILPIKAGITALAGDQGLVIVARYGTESAADSKSTIPLRVGDREVGLVTVSTEVPLTEDELKHAQESLRPVALAFANVQLLQDIARRAIREERARISRELHDEIGPSLASLGLAVDLAILQNPSEPAMASHLQHLRDSVGGLVEEIRATVADLREPEQPSLIEAIKDIAQEPISDDIHIEVKLDELRPPRPSIAGDVTSIIIEAMRNALRHSRASTITIHGTSDFDTGDVTVHDDGVGFVADRIPSGHFGLIGMQERTDKIGASLNVSTGKQGTAVTITWGPK